MINSSLKYSIAAITVFLSAVPALSAELNCAAAPDCESLGYTVASNECLEGIQVKCPTDPSKVFCQAALSCNGVVGDIIFGDGSCASMVLKNKTPVAVIFDDEQRLAVSLTFVDKNGYAIKDVSDTSNAGVPWAESGGGDVAGLENCYVGMMGFLACSSDGRQNTQTIIEYDAGKNIHHAALAASKFEPSGCQASICKKGKWWLPSLLEINTLQGNASVVENSLYDLRNLTATSPVADETQLYWSSNENKDGRGAFLSKQYVDHGKYETSPLVRPIVQY